MTMIRRLGQMLRKTPLHPQWLLGGNASLIGWISRDARGRVLDVGCADRWIESQLSEGCEYIGLDYPATGKELYDARPSVFADASRLPFLDESMDTIVMLEVLEHLRSPNEAMREIARVLRPGGRLLLSMPFLYPIHDAPYDYQRLTRHGLVRDAEDAGIHVDAVYRRLGSSATAGLLVCLALAGSSVEAIRARSLGIVFVPLALAFLPVVNLLAWGCELLLPSWGAITNGYLLIARKPCPDGMRMEAVHDRHGAHAECEA